MAETARPPGADQLLNAEGSACALLTPLINARLKPMQPGQVLEVVSDDEAAREGVPAWVRLTGHTLLATVEVDAERTRFYLRRK